MRKYFSFILIFTTKCLFAQDIEYSQYYANPLYLNPAFAGSEQNTRITLNYKSTLPSSSGNYSTYSASIDKYLKQINGGLGLQIMNDRQAQGIINDLDLNLSYAFQVRLNKRWLLSTGLKVEYNVNTINARNITMPDMLDPIKGKLPSTSETKLYQQTQCINFGIGFLSWFKNYYVGGAVDHLIKPLEVLGSKVHNARKRKYTLHGGVKIPFYNSLHRENMSISPNLIFQQQGSFSKINLGLYLNKNLLTTGLWIKTNTQIKLTGIVFMLGYIGDYTTFAYSYDMLFFKEGISGILKGAHEVTFSYNLEYKRKRKKIRAIKCPKI